MAITNRERVGKSLDLLKEGLGPFIEREIKSAIESRKLADDRLPKSKPTLELDVAGMLKLMRETWHDVFRKILGSQGNNLVNELHGYRNKWAHQEAFSSDDAYRALDSAERLLTSISASQSEEIGNLKMELLRVRFDEQARNERRKQAGTIIESKTTVNLTPWREVVHPHKDVASGRYQQAEFAADLWQVHIGKGTNEYRNSVEFFRRTYLTESLKGLLVGAIRRTAGKGGDPVVQLQTNFGGGKTHSMLALYHLFSGTPVSELTGIDAVLQEAEATNVVKANRVVLVGNKISPGNPTTKPDGTIVRTLWGELAWQLGGKKAFTRIAADDEKATNPGDVLRELFEEYGPCLVLIDEWVAYARQLHDQIDGQNYLSAGNFETQFSFAQALTEAARDANNCLLVISLPASEVTGSPHTHADDVEVGGQRGREALNSLRNVVGRIESSWRPASAEESFEIVRRRLFEPFSEPAQFKNRDVVARAFADFYQTQHQEFPSECQDVDYEKRIKAAYPIHPEIFDRLYTDWSALENFQRTRGVLRLMATVIHNLWEKGDRNPLILPANIALDDSRIQFELTRHLTDNWVPVIEKDVDGPRSLPRRIDGEVPNLGKFSASRRVARSIYLGSAPTAGTAHRGLEDRRVKLGCVMPGEPPAVFGDALRRLASTATYLYQDGPRYWYSTQPTVMKLAEDRAEQLKRDPDKIEVELDARLRADLQNTGDFKRVHPFPQSSQDLPDDFDVRLVVLGIKQHYSKEPENPAQVAARTILEKRGSASRIYRNTLVFLAADKTRLQDLDEATRYFLAWKSVLEEREGLDLSPHQVKQAEIRREAASNVVAARIPETYQWLLVPVQTRPDAPITWQPIKLSGQGHLASRASKKLQDDGLLITAFAGTLLRIELDSVPLWRDNHVSIKQITEDFAQYLYLPRISESSVLHDAIHNGAGLLTWERDGFAVADSYDEEAQRYRGLQSGRIISWPDVKTLSLLVKSNIARHQIDVEATEVVTNEKNIDTEFNESVPVPDTTSEITTPSASQSPPPPTRFHGSVALDSARVGVGASQIADEVISHLSGLIGGKVTVVLEIEAEIPSGAPDHVIRTVTENSKILGFISHGFEQK